MPDERDWHNSELDRKWAHWASLVRMDLISVYIRKNCEEPGGGVWEIEEPIFRAGMGLEAVSNRSVGMNHLLMKSALYWKDIRLGLSAQRPDAPRRVPTLQAPPRR